ncbi:MAG TPA: ABC transporter ATP-binding protein, partial [Syntrophobacteraceae bacterium]|nr:ABC transporter ATP-binding protein [Syntrophobacteraceae bacterium]
MVAVRDVYKSYRRGPQMVPVLLGIQLEIVAGDFVALMGPSGSGKTTLLNLIAGIDRPDEGHLLVAGTDITQLDETELARWRAATVGFIFQFYNLLPVLTAVENVELPLLVSGVRAGEARRRAQEGLAWVGLAGWAGHRPAELSGGQRQR